MKKIIFLLILAPCALLASAQNSRMVVQSNTIFEAPAEAFTYHNFRIPSFLVSKSDVYYAFIEGREGKNADHAENDIVMRRSFNGGEHWTTTQIVTQDGKNCTMNPTVVEGKNGRIILTYLWFPHKFHTSSNPSQGITMCDPGYEGRISKNYVIYSDNQGETWSTPIDVTKIFKLSEETVIAMPGPGLGVSIQKGKYRGRIVIPLCDVTKNGDWLKFLVYAAWSDDNGLTWEVGERVTPTAEGEGGDEVQIVELSNNTLMLNTRTRSGHRALAYSHDGGATWSNLKLETTLVDTGCMGSTLNYTNGKTKILLASTVTARFENRRRGKAILYGSLNEGKSWKELDVIYTDKFDYGVMQQLPNGNVGLLAEYDFNGERAVTKLTELDINQIIKKMSTSSSLEPSGK
ncbi:MAG: sialidase family protein [Rikenellaceae bacterium]